MERRPLCPNLLVNKVSRSCSFPTQHMTHHVAQMATMTGQRKALDSSEVFEAWEGTTGIRMGDMYRTTGYYT